MASKRQKLSLSQEDLLMRGGVLRKLVSEVKDLCVIVYDRRGIVTEVCGDNLLEKRFGISGARAIGKNVSDILPASEARPKLQAIAEVFKTGKKQHLDSHVASPSGDLWLCSTLCPWSDEQGEVKAVVNLVRDTTEREQARAECSEYRKVLTETLDQWQTSKTAYQAKTGSLERLSNLGRYSAAIAHEINNPIGNILLSAELARKKPDDPEFLDRAITLIEQNARACKQIVESILSLTSSGTRHWTSGRIEDVVKEAKETLALDESMSSCKIRSETHDTPDLVMMDAVALRQAVLNLMRNAIQAGATEVLIHVRQKSPGILLSVSDNGSGMTEEQVNAALSEDFTPNPRSRGTGLGLGIVQQITRLHKGRCSIESREGDGTTITLLFPPASGFADEPPIPPAP